MAHLPPLPLLATGDGFVVAGKPPRLLVHRTALSSDRKTRSATVWPISCALAV